MVTRCIGCSHADACGDYGCGPLVRAERCSTAMNGVQIGLEERRKRAPRVYKHRVLLFCVSPSKQGLVVAWRSW